MTRDLFGAAVSAPAKTGADVFGTPPVIPPASSSLATPFMARAKAPFVFSDMGADVYNAGVLGSQLMGPDVAIAPQDASGNVLQGNGYKALAIDPRSDVRAIVAYFDDDKIGVPIYGGRVVRRDFSTVKVDLLYYSDRNALRVGGTYKAVDGSGFVTSGPTLNLNPQRMRLQLWLEDPRVDFLPMPPASYIASPVLQTPSQVPVLLQLGSLHTPGAQAIQFWLSNGGTTNPDVLSLSVYAVKMDSAGYYDGAGRHYEKGNAGNILTAGTSGRQLWLGVIPSVGDNAGPLVSEWVNPGDYNFIIVQSAGGASGAYQMQWGARIVYGAGM